MTPNYDLKAAADAARKSYREVTAKLGLLGFDTAIPEARARPWPRRAWRKRCQATDRSMDAFETSVATL